MTQDDKADPVMRAFPQSKALLLSELEKVLEATRHYPPTSHQGQLHMTAVQMRALLLAEPYKYKPPQEDTQAQAHKEQRIKFETAFLKWRHRLVEYL